MTHPNDSLNPEAQDDHAEEEIVLEAADNDPVCKEKDVDGKKRIRRHFGRRTHNEQIMVRPCGIIVARSTFFGSETTPQTIVSLQYDHHKSILTFSLF